MQCKAHAVQRARGDLSVGIKRGVFRKNIRLGHNHGRDIVQRQIIIDRAAGVRELHRGGE